MRPPSFHSRSSYLPESRGRAAARRHLRGSAMLAGGRTVLLPIAGLNPTCSTITSGAQQRPCSSGPAGKRSRFSSRGCQAERVARCGSSSRMAPKSKRRRSRSSSKSATSSLPARKRTTTQGRSDQPHPSLGSVGFPDKSEISADRSEGRNSVPGAGAAWCRVAGQNAMRVAALRRIAPIRCVHL